MMYKEALARQWTHIAMRIMIENNQIVLQNRKRTLPALLQSMNASPFFMENKLSMLKFFLPKLQFHDCDILVTNLQKLVADSTSESGILVANINPFLVATTILVLCEKVKINFPLA